MSEIANITIDDYEAIRAVVERALPKLDFRDPDHALAGDELLAMLNCWGARLERRKQYSKEDTREKFVVVL